MKFCVDCKHYKDDKGFLSYNPVWHLCNRDRPHEEIRSLVTGNMILTYNKNSTSHFCTDERNAHPIFFWKCGKKARYFEPKETQQ